MPVNANVTHIHSYSGLYLWKRIVYWDKFCLQLHGYKLTLVNFSVTESHSHIWELNWGSFLYFQSFVLPSPGLEWVCLFVNPISRSSFSAEWVLRFRTKKTTHQFKNIHCNTLILFTLDGFVSQILYFFCSVNFLLLELNVIIKVFKQNFLYWCQIHAFR